MWSCFSSWRGETAQFDSDYPVEDEASPSLFSPGKKWLPVSVRVRILLTKYRCPPWAINNPSPPHFHPCSRALDDANHHEIPLSCLPHRPIRRTSSRMPLLSFAPAPPLQWVSSPKHLPYRSDSMILLFLTDLFVSGCSLEYCYAPILHPIYTAVSVVKSSTRPRGNGEIRWAGIEEGRIQIHVCLVQLSKHLISSSSATSWLQEARSLAALWHDGQFRRRR